MNMKYRSLILALSAIFMAGCHSLETSNKITDEVPFTASSESFQPQTKTSMTQDRQVVWSQGDRLAIFQSATIAVCYTEDFPIELLEQQRYHEVGIRVFFWQNHIVSTLHLAEPFSIHNRIKAENLLQLRIQEAIQS